MRSWPAPFAVRNSRRDSADLINHAQMDRGMASMPGGQVDPPPHRVNARPANSGHRAPGNPNSHRTLLEYGRRRDSREPTITWAIGQSSRMTRALQLHGTPYMGDLQLCSWNAQALMATYKAKRSAKWKQCWKLLQKHDILAMQETQYRGQHH